MIPTFINNILKPLIALCGLCLSLRAANPPIYGVRTDTNGLITAPANFFAINGITNSATLFVDPAGNDTNASRERHTLTSRDVYRGCRHPMKTALNFLVKVAASPWLPVALAARRTIGPP